MSPSIIGPYRIIGVLGRGGMGIVYRGEHRDTGELVAIKTVSLPSEALIACIRREIHALARFHHPSIARVVGQGSLEGMPWYAMELLEGETLRVHIERVWTRGTGALSTLDAASSVAPSTLSTLAGMAASADGDGSARPCGMAMPDTPLDAVMPLLALIRSLCAPVGYLHGEGFVHRDLKPENVLVKDAGQAVLVDFGVASSFGGAQGREQVGAGGKRGGSIMYMAPEQIRGELVDARTDLYALGCMLYECVTGRPPFLGPSDASIVYQHLNSEPLLPSSIVRSVPGALDRLIMQLLEKQPRHRLGYADDVAEVLRALGASGTEPGEEPRHRPYVYRADLAGREDVLDELSGALVRLSAAGQGQRIFIGGESGMGKTRLALELALRATAQGIRVIAGTGVTLGAHGAAQDPNVAAPLHPFLPLLLAVADFCREHGAGETRALLGPHGKVLAAYEPSLGELPGVEDSAEPMPLPPEAARARVISALLDVLEALSQRSPVVLVLDDLHWADELSLELLRILCTSRLEQTVLLVGMYRLEEMSSTLRHITRADGVRNVVLERLDRASIGAMVSGMLALPEPPASLVSFIADHCDGNPFFISQYLQVAITENVLTRGPAGRWQLAGQAGAASVLAAALPVPGGIAELLDRRLRGLDEPSRVLVRVAAVLGHEVELDVLATASELDELAAIEAIETLRTRHILEAVDNGRLRFVHDKLREASYGATEPTERRRLHRRVAEALEQDGPPAEHYHALAFHFRLAGDVDKTTRYAELAGRAAFAIGAYRASCEHLTTALAGLDPGDEATRFRRAQLCRLLGDALLGVGELDRSEQRLIEAIETFGVTRWPSSRPRWMATLGRELVRQLGFRLGISRPARVGQSRRATYEESAEVALRAEHYLHFAEYPITLPTTYLLAANLAERAGALALMSRAQARLGMVAGITGAERLAAYYFDRSRESARRSGSVTAELDQQRTESIYHLLRCRWDAARRLLEPQLAGCKAAGDVYQTEQTLITLSVLGWLRGDGRGKVEAMAVVESAARHGHALHLAWGWFWRGLHETYEGDLASAVAHLDQAEQYFRTEGTGFFLNVLGAGAEARRCMGDLDAAVGKLDEAREVLARNPRLGRSSYHFNRYAPGVYLAAWRQAMERGMPVALLATRAVQACRSISRYAGWSAATLAPAAARSRAELATLRGQHRRALRQFRAAIEHARRLDMPFEEARGCWALAHLAQAATREERARANRRADVLRSRVGLRSVEA